MLSDTRLLEIKAILKHRYALNCIDPTHKEFMIDQLYLAVVDLLGERDEILDNKCSYYMDSTGRTRHQS